MCMYNGESRLFIDILRNRLSANILKFAQTALDRRCLSHETNTPSISTASMRSSACLLILDGTPCPQETATRDPYEEPQQRMIKRCV